MAHMEQCIMKHSLAPVVYEQVIRCIHVCIHVYSDTWARWASIPRLAGHFAPIANHHPHLAYALLLTYSEASRPILARPRAHDSNYKPYLLGFIASGTSSLPSTSDATNLAVAGARVIPSLQCPHATIRLLSP